MAEFFRAVAVLALVGGLFFGALLIYYRVKYRIFPEQAEIEAKRDQVPATKRAVRAWKGDHPREEPHTGLTALLSVLPHITRMPTRLLPLLVSVAAVATVPLIDESGPTGALATLHTVGGVCLLWILLGYRHFFFGKAVIRRYAESGTAGS